MKYLCLLILLIPGFTMGQSADRQVWAAQGGFDRGQTITLSWTLGEIFTETTGSGDRLLTQGFQQPDFSITQLSLEHEEMQASLYPNPTWGHLTLKSSPGLGEIQVEIIDMLGKVLHQDQYEGHKLELDLTHYPVGQYVIRISGSNRLKQKAYRVIKQ